MKVIVVYDDTGKKSEVISDIIGDRGFGDVVIQKTHLEDICREEIERCFPDAVWKKLKSDYDYPALVKELELFVGLPVKVLHYFSNELISDSAAASLSLRKLEFIDAPYGVLCDARAACAMFPDVQSYLAFCRSVMSGQKAWDLVRSMDDTFEIEGVLDIGDFDTFIQCVTGNFDARYFNSLKGDEYTIVKSSADKKKIRAEYSFYHLLPEDMRYWFVMPFDYREDEAQASYTMERLHMTDLAIKWVHGSMSEAEFEKLMDRYFMFFGTRHTRECSAETAKATADALYVKKVTERLDALKALPAYDRIRQILEAAGEPGVDALYARYLDLKQRIEARVRYPQIQVIGHGDPCFANTLYSRLTDTLKFIDPKGALTEEDLWTNPYYDVAKLSHSVCGRYDFFNNGLFEIKMDPDLSLHLEIPFDVQAYREIFRRKMEENGFDYLTVRIYEVSLFLSMLPLHMDNPYKVLGFILNTKQLLEEIEEDV